MNFIIGNIGGSKAYKNVLKFLNNIKFTTDIPDMAIIQEPGDKSLFLGLQPFFDDHQSAEKIRIHLKKNLMDWEIKIDKVFDIIIVKVSKLSNSRKYDYLYGLVFT